MHKVYLIDSEKREVRESTAETLEDYRTAVGGNIEVATIFRNGDTVYVNEEGLFQGFQNWFAIRGVTHQCFAGNGIVGGVDKGGECVDVKTPIKELGITYLTQEEARKWCDQPG
jgi:hypothetical protein